MLNRQAFLVRKRSGILWTSNISDILDPATREQIGAARETPLPVNIFLRLLLSRKTRPTRVRVCQGGDPNDESNLVFSLEKRGFWVTRLTIFDPQGREAGRLEWAAILLDDSFGGKGEVGGGALRVFGPDGQEVARVKGDWKDWSFRLVDHEGKELGAVAKTWSGLGREMILGAGEYLITIKEKPDPARAILLLAAGLALEMLRG